MTKRESNILKCVAIMLMLFHHLFMYANWPGFPELAYGPLLSTPELLANFGKMGNVCVSIFVFVTAYGTTVSYRDRNMDNGHAIMEKSTRRMVKLLFNFQFVYIIFYALCPLGGSNWLTFYSSSRLENLAFAIIDFFGLSYIFDTPTYNSSWWYMSLAITLIFLVPWAIKFFRRYGVMALLAATLLGYYLDTYFEFIHYLPCVFVGIVLADRKLLERIKEWGEKAGPLLRHIAAGLCGVTAFILMWYLPKTDWYVKGLSEAAICCGIAILVVLGPSKTSGLKKAAEFVGKHSMNMYFVHVFIFDTWFEDFTYSLKSPALIFSFLFISSLALSLAIEKLKSFVHLDHLAELAANKLCTRLRCTATI